MVFFWYTNKMKYFIGYVTKGEINEYYKKIATEVSEKYGTSNLAERIPPHITLIPTFESEDMKVIEQKVTEALKNKSKFSFYIEGFERFKDGKETIFLGIHMDESQHVVLREIIANIGDVGQNTEFETYTPHLSMVRYLENDKSDEIFEYLNKLPKKKFDLVFDSLCILVKDGNNVWSVEKTIDIVE